jgi:hypothetical protein
MCFEESNREKGNIVQCIDSSRVDPQRSDILAIQRVFGILKGEYFQSAGGESGFGEGEQPF